MTGSKKVLITGLFGRTGIYFLRELRRAFDAGNLDFEIHCIVRRRELLQNSDALAIGIIFHVGDISDKAFLKSCMNDIDILFHISGISMSSIIVPIAVDSGVKQLILVHTTGIYSKYKAAGEGYRNIESEIRSYIADREVDMTIIRPTLIYGSIKDNNMVIFIKLVDKLRLFPLVSGGKFKLQPVNAEDLGIAYFQMLQHIDVIKGKEYILSGRDEIYLRDMLKMIAQYLNKKTCFFTIPFPIAYSGAWIVYCLSLGKVDYREKVQRLVEPRIFSHESAKQDIGYDPMPFADGLKREVVEYLETRHSH